MVMAAEVEKEYRYQPCMEGLVAALSQFKEDAKCLQETYGDTIQALETHRDDIKKQYDAFVEKNKVKTKGMQPEEIIIPQDKKREYNALLEKYKRAERACVLVSQNYLVSLVSVYDSFFAELIRIIYTLCPQLLNTEQSTFTYSDLQKYESIGQVGVSLVEKKVESLMRDSHIAQINALEQILKVGTLKKFNGWEQFVELTERRNLFVHTNGKISTQYVAICKKYNAPIGDCEIGTTLTIDKEYFLLSYRTLYKMAVMLTAVVANKYCPQHYKKFYEELDKLMINHIFYMINEQELSMAIEVSQYILSSPFKHKQQDKCYIILNLAQAYKWNGQEDKCIETLSQEDSSAWKPDLLIPKLSLEENYPDVYENMRSLGKTGKILHPKEYREWPIFQKLREQKEFLSIFKEIFGENFNQNTNVVVEDIGAPTGESTCVKTDVES